MTAEQKIEHILAIFGALVPFLSALASIINHKVREAQEAGEDVSPLLLHTGSVLNVGAVNLDKAVQLAKLARAAKGKGAVDASEG